MGACAGRVELPACAALVLAVPVLAGLGLAAEAASPTDALGKGRVLFSGTRRLGRPAGRTAIWRTDIVGLGSAAVGNSRSLGWTVGVCTICVRLGCGVGRLRTLGNGVGMSRSLGTGRGSAVAIDGCRMSSTRVGGSSKSLGSRAISLTTKGCSAGAGAAADRNAEVLVRAAAALEQATRPDNLARQIDQAYPEDRR